MHFQVLASKGNKHYILQAQHISHFVANDKYTDIYLIANNQKFTEYHLLQHYENLLNGSHLFIKLGRSHLVNKTQIVWFDRHKIYLLSGAELPLTESSYKELLSIFD